MLIIAFCEARTNVVHNPASKVASFPGLPTIQFLQYTKTGRWEGLQRYHEVDRSSTLMRDRVHGWKFSYILMRWAEVQHNYVTEVTYLFIPLFDSEYAYILLKLGDSCLNRWTVSFVMFSYVDCMYRGSDQLHDRFFSCPYSATFS